MADLIGSMLGPYVVRERLDEGSSGAVYRCEDPKLRRSLALKVLHSNVPGGDRARERFLRGAKLASGLDHPSTVRIIDFGAPVGHPMWIAMELVPGTSLKKLLDARGALSPDVAMPILKRLATGVDYAHQKGILHLDLKPANIMVRELDGESEVVLVDFGLAKPAPQFQSPLPQTWPEGSMGENCDSGRSSPITPVPESSSFAGSLAYVSPERWSDSAPVGRGADVYSFGIVAFQILTGRVPFQASSLEDFYRKHLYALVPPLGVGFNDDVNGVFAKVLAKHPKDRYDTAMEFVSALGGALGLNERELVRLTAQSWAQHDHSPQYLLREGVLTDLAQKVPLGRLAGIQCSLVANSQRRARRVQWLRRAATILVAVAGFGLYQYHSWTEARTEAQLAAQQMENLVRLTNERVHAAQRVADATAGQAEIDEGRSALLHGESDAMAHLAAAYRYDASPATAFMYARAIQPRLAERAKFISSMGRMWSAAFSPDGRQIVTSDDQSAQIYDAATYRPIVALPHNAEVYQAIYSADGSRLITTARDAVRIWDPVSGALLKSLQSKNEDGEHANYFISAISARGDILTAMNASGSAAYVWDAHTGKALARLHGRADDFPNLAFSNDDLLLASTGGYEVQVFETKTWRKALTIGGPRVHRVVFAPDDGWRLLTGSATGDVSIWDARSGARLRHLREVGEAVDAIAFSRDGQLVVAGSNDGVVQVWNSRSGELTSQLNTGHGRVLSVEVDRSGRLVLAACADGAVVVADVVNGTLVSVLDGPQGNVRVAHFDPGSKRVLGASKDGTARVWDAGSPYLQWRSDPMVGCSSSNPAEINGRFVAIPCVGRATYVWDTSRGRLVAALPSSDSPSGGAEPPDPAVSSAGTFAAIAHGSSVDIYQLPSGQVIRTIVHAAQVSALAFSATGEDVVSGATDGSVLLSHKDGAITSFPAMPAAIDAVAVLADGRIIAADADGRAWIYSASRNVGAELALPGRVAALRPEGSLVLTVPMAPPATRISAPVLLDVDRPHVIARLDGHVGRVFSARWVAGQQVLTAGADGTVRLWNGSTGQPLRTYRDGPRYLADAILTSEGFVIAGGADGNLRFWDSHDGRVLWRLPAHKSQLIGVGIDGEDILTRGFTGEISRWRLPKSHDVITVCDGEPRCAIVAP